VFHLIAEINFVAGVEIHLLLSKGGSISMENLWVLFLALPDGVKLLLLVVVAVVLVGLFSLTRWGKNVPFDHNRL
jgi:hypothetical protein